MAVDLASRRSVDALVVQSSFTSLREMAGRLYPLGDKIAVERFDSRSKIGLVTAPVLLIHGDRDELVPFEMGEQLHRASGGRKELLRIAGAGHNDVWELAPDEIARRVAALVPAPKSATP